MRILLLITLTCWCGLVWSQQYPTRTVGKDTYYVYKVEPGNTLYGISRQFSVAISDLELANPDLTSGLNPGQELLIPVKAINKKESRNQEVSLEGQFILHTVQPKETLFSIAKSYGVKVDDIKAVNLGIDEGIQIGSVLKIPSVSTTAAPVKYTMPASLGNQKLHRVKQGETLFSIAKIYDLTPTQIQEANGFSTNDLQVGYWIKIPEKAEISLENYKINTEVMTLRGSKEKYKLVYALPFELTENDSLDKMLYQGIELNVLTEIALDFYRGSRLALDSLRKLGFKADVHFIDVGEDIVNAKEALRKSQISDADLIVGPFHKNSFALFSDQSLKQKAFVVSPNSFANEVFEDNPYLIRSQASRETLLRYLATYVAVQHRADNVVMVASTASQDAMYRSMFKTHYNEALSTFPNAVRDSLKAIRKSDITEEGLRGSLQKDKLNVLVVPSNELAFVSDLITKLSRIKTDYRIQLYGLDTWLKYDNIDVEYKDQFTLRLVVPAYVDYTKTSVNAFLKLYRDRYKMDPTVYGYGFQGFDLTMLFGKAMMAHGMDFLNYPSSLESLGLFTNYRIGKSTTGKEWENKSAYIIEYSDYTIKQIN